MNEHITTELVVELRKRTGVGMSKCKEALVETSGDLEKAIDVLRKKGMASAVKKGSRETNEGVIGFAENNKALYLIEVNAETDFVTQNDHFKRFLQSLAEDALTLQPKSVEDFLKKKSLKHPALTIDEYRAEIVQTLGENIQIRRLLDFKKLPDHSYGIYSHMGGKIVTVAVIKGSSEVTSLAREIAMHIAAEAPDYLYSSDVPAEVKQREEEIARSQLHNKPKEMIDKILQGKMKTFYEATCLVDQKFVKDPSMSVKAFVEKEGKKEGKNLEVVEFVRWQMGA
ncbi:MAG: elongation factor Ts [Simkania negevensis]|nr:elongation factor Ts [Simkania negevensis]